MRTWITSAAVIAGLLASAAALGQCKEATAAGSSQEKAGGCCKSGAVAQASGGCCKGSATAVAGCSTGKTCGSDALAKSGSKLPAMLFKVGDKTVCCPEQAKSLAKGDEKVMQYVVADKTYTDEAEATEAYGKALDAFFSEITTVKYAVGDNCMACPMSAKELAQKEGKKVQYRLATFSFNDQETANKAAAAAKEAAGKVEMKMMVGDECVACPVSAKELAQKSGKRVEYVVGEMRTQCDKAAKVELNRARAAAALATIEKAASGNQG